MIYEYQCKTCSTVFERDFPMGKAEPQVACECGADAKRKFSVGCLQVNGAGNPSNADAFNREMTARNERAGKRMRKEHGDGGVRLAALDYGNGDVREVKK